MEKFLPTYGPLHWPQTWRQLHLCKLDRTVIDLNWQVAHGVLYTGARLAHRFHMNVDLAAFVQLTTRPLIIFSLNASWLAFLWHGFIST